MEYQPAEIAVSNGAKICVTLRCAPWSTLETRSSCPRPTGSATSSFIQMVGGVPLWWWRPPRPSTSRITPREARCRYYPKTKCMILNNPSNPTGMMYSRQELEAIAQVCVEKDIYVISDEIYYRPGL